jgi:hypothetical protein
MAGQNRGSGPRSNIYSGSNFTNWKPNDPHWAEVNAFPSLMRPSATITLSDGQAIRIFQRPLAPGFLCPCSVADVTSVLHQVPVAFTSGLENVYLLGRTARQRQLRRGLYGFYFDNSIYLSPLPERLLTQTWSPPPKPSVAQKFIKFGATFDGNKGGAVTMSFDSLSLRAFYLYDVLLHELGHLVSKGKPSRSEERYAKPSSVKGLLLVEVQGH